LIPSFPQKNLTVAVGGLGGSGTRLIAQILMEIGIYMGDDLNGVNDNLIFARLLKNPPWLESASKAEVNKRLEVFEHYMSGEKLIYTEISEYFKACRTNPTFLSNFNSLIAIVCTFQLLKRQALGRIKRHSEWGWKEPNNHIFIEYLVGYFSGIKYIHVVRHGLDMAYSKNKAQLKFFGKRFGIKVKDWSDDNEVTKKQLDYWIKTTETAIAKGKELLKERFYLLNYDMLCSQPAVEVPKLINFLGIQVNNQELEKLIMLPRVTSSQGRYKNHDLSLFTKEQISSVENLGFKVV